MQYYKSANGKWHREDCPYNASHHDQADQLPIYDEHCDRCIATFQFP